MNNIEKLNNELQEVQNKRTECYKMLNKYLNKMFDGKLTLIDYLNMVVIDDVINELDLKSKRIVRKINDIQNEKRTEKLFDIDNVIIIGARW